MGRRELFPTVSVAPGETLVRAFHEDENAAPMKCSFNFGVTGSTDQNTPADLTVTLGCF